MKFKTNARCGGCKAAITEALATLAPASDWQMDLESPDKVLTYTGSLNLNPEEVMAIVRQTGFSIEQLPD